MRGSTSYLLKDPLSHRGLGLLHAGVIMLTEKGERKDGVCMEHWFGDVSFPGSGVLGPDALAVFWCWSQYGVVTVSGLCFGGKKLCPGEECLESA